MCQKHSGDLNVSHSKVKFPNHELETQHDLISYSITKGIQAYKVD